MDLSTPKFNMAGTVPSLSTENVEATLRNDDGGIVVEFGGFRLPVPSEVVAARPDLRAFGGRTIVLGINREEQKISLGLRQLETNPWDRAQEKYPPGTHVKGKIRNLTSYGAFIELEEGLDGMIHVSDISWTRKINHPSEVLKKGDEIEAIVLEVDRTIKVPNDPRDFGLNFGVIEVRP